MISYNDPSSAHICTRSVSYDLALNARPRVNTVKLTYTQKYDVHMKKTVTIYVNFDTCFNIKPNSRTK